MRTVHTGSIVAAVVALAAAQQAVGAGTSCGRAKLQTVAKLAACRVAAWRKADHLGASPDADLATCESKFTTRWQPLDALPDCLTTGDASSVGDEIGACLDGVAGHLVTAPRTIFTTAASFHGGPGPVPPNFSYMSGADATCQTVADAVPALQGKRWVAWLSGLDPDTHAFVSARDRTTHSPGPYVRADGVLVAVNFDGLTSGSLLAPLEKDEHGDPLPDAWGAWTGTNPDGSGAAGNAHCDYWNNNGIAVAGWIGDPAATDANWSQWSLQDCEWSFHLYCIEQ